MKKQAKLVVIILLIIIVGAVLTMFFLSQKSDSVIGYLSSDQQNVVDILGYPQQFTISYIHKNIEDESQLIRSEVWYYPTQQKEVSFLAGRLADSKNYTSDSSPTATTLHPESFTFGQSLDEISSILGTKNVREAKDLPGFESDLDIKVYVSPQAMFLIENGYLTYFQTLGTGGDILKESD